MNRDSGHVLAEKPAGLQGLHVQKVAGPAQKLSVLGIYASRYMLCGAWGVGGRAHRWTRCGAWGWGEGGLGEGSQVDKVSPSRGSLVNSQYIYLLGLLQLTKYYSTTIV